MVQMRRLFLSLLAGAALVGCSSGGGSGSGPTINSFTATPNSLPAGGGSVTLAWNVTGATSLSIDQGVGAVTPATTGSTSVQVTATTTFTLTATGSGGNSTQTAPVTVAPGPVTVTVNGTVTDEEGTLAPGETVLVTNADAGFSQSAVSSSTGTFSIASVPTPYDVTVIDSGGKNIVAYLGLTRPDPTLIDLTIVTPPLSATLAGTVSGGTFPETSDYATQLRFASPQTSIESSDLTVATSGAYTGDVKWSGPSNTTGTLYALQTHTVSGLPVDYSYATLSDVLLQNMGGLSGENIALTPVTAGQVSGTITAPTGFTVSEAELLLFTAPGSFFGIDGTITTTTFSYVTPAISGATFNLLVGASGGGSSGVLFKKSGIAANATGIAATLAAPPTQTLPVDTATGVTLTTPFSWSSFEGVYLWIVSTPSGPSYYVFTAATTATIPDLTSAGIQLPASASYTWVVIGIGPQTSIDELAVPSSGLIGLEVFTDGTFSESGQRSFTTSP